MPLRAAKPSTVQKRLKALVYGQAGSGKTTFACNFPRPYLIDTERGAENKSYTDALTAAGGAYLFTPDADDVIAEVRTLIAEKHEYRTLIIDPLTVVYNDLLDRSVEKIGGADPTAFGRHKVEPDRKVKHLLALLLRLDMNVIITSHAKPQWKRAIDSRGKETVVQDGLTFDCYGRLDYLFDLVLEVGKRGTERVATVKKTRLAEFGDGEIMAFSYSAVAEKYGRDVIERGCVSIPLATPEQVAEFEALISDRTNAADIREKCLTKSEAETLSEIPQTTMAAYIARLKAPAAGAGKDSK